MPVLSEVPASCAACGFDWDEPLGSTLTANAGDTVSVVFAPGAVPTSCPRCKVDLVNPASVTGLITPQGIAIPTMQLRPILRGLVTQDRAELLALRKELQQVRQERNVEAAERALRRVGGRNILGGQANRMELWAIISALSGVVTVVLMLRPVEAPQLSHDIERVVASVVAYLDKPAPSGTVECPPPPNPTKSVPSKSEMTDKAKTHGTAPDTVDP